MKLSINMMKFLRPLQIQLVLNYQVLMNSMVMIIQNWIYQFNLPTLSEVNLSISNNDDIVGQPYLYNVGGSGIGGYNYSGGFAFDGILEKGEYVLGISPFGYPNGDFPGAVAKHGLKTNFDLDAEFAPISMGPDQGGNPYIVQDGKFLIVNGRYVLDDPNNEGAYIDLGTFGEADAAVVNEFVMDDQVTLSKTGEFGNNHDIRDGYSFTIEGNQDL